MASSEPVGVLVIDVGSWLHGLSFGLISLGSLGQGSELLPYVFLILAISLDC